MTKSREEELEEWRRRSLNYTVRDGLLDIVIPGRILYMGYREVKLFGSDCPEALSDLRYAIAIEACRASLYLLGAYTLLQEYGARG